MNNILKTELILIVCWSVVLIFYIVYKRYEVNKIKKKIEYIEFQNRNYEIILSKMLKQKE